MTHTTILRDAAKDVVFAYSDEHTSEVGLGRTISNLAAALATADAEGAGELTPVAQAMEADAQAFEQTLPMKARRVPDTTYPWGWRYHDPLVQKGLLAWCQGARPAPVGAVQAPDLSDERICQLAKDHLSGEYFNDQICKFVRECLAAAPAAPIVGMTRKCSKFGHTCNCATDCDPSQPHPSTTHTAAEHAKPEPVALCLIQDETPVEQAKLAEGAAGLCQWLRENCSYSICTAEAVELLAKLDAWRGSNADAAYRELIHAVGNKWPSETRHQTALRYIRQAEAGQQAGAVDGEVITDEQIIGVLHSLGTDTALSVYGFDALQVSGTNLPGMKGIVQKCIACIQSGEWPAPMYDFDSDGKVVYRAASANQKGE